MAGTGTHQVRQDPSENDKDHKDNIRVDLLIRGHFYQGTNLLVYVRVTDLDAKYQVRTNPDKVLATHEKKKAKYLDLCLA